MTGQDAVATAVGFHGALAARRRDPHQARRRRPRRRRALYRQGCRPADRLRLDRRAPGRLRDVPAGPDGRPDPRHGGRAVARRAAEQNLDGDATGAGDGAHAARTLHARGLPRPAPADEDGWVRSRASSGMLPGLPKEMRNAASTRGTHADRGGHPLDDPGRAQRPGDHQRVAPDPDRRRQRDDAGRRERPPEPVQGDAEADAFVGDDGAGPPRRRRRNARVAG